MHKTDEQFLSDMYRGAKMGTETIDTVLSKVDDKRMKDELIRQQHDFKKFEVKIMEEMSKIGAKPHDIPLTQKMGSKMGIMFNTAVDNTPSHIADLMIQGNNMGVVGTTKLKNSDKENGFAPLCDEFVQMSERNIEKLKQFL